VSVGWNGEDFEDAVFDSLGRQQDPEARRRRLTAALCTLLGVGGLLAASAFRFPQLRTLTDSPEDEVLVAVELTDPLDEPAPPLPTLPESFDTAAGTQSTPALVTEQAAASRETTLPDTPPAEVQVSETTVAPGTPAEEGLARAESSGDGANFSNVVVKRHFRQIALVYRIDLLRCRKEMYAGHVGNSQMAHVADGCCDQDATWTRGRWAFVGGSDLDARGACPDDPGYPFQSVGESG
jgi:hypothetical protein